MGKSDFEAVAVLGNGTAGDFVEESSMCRAPVLNFYAQFDLM